MNKQFVAVVVITFIVIIVWIIADILHTKPSVPLNPKLDTLLTPISPNFDQKVISQIKEVTPVDEIEVPEKPQPKPAVSQPALSSSSAIQVATTGGSLQ
jgi:cell division protein FtsN